jgi:hypothetical protein
VSSQNKNIEVVTMPPAVSKATCGRTSRFGAFDQVNGDFNSDCANSLGYKSSQISKI